MTKLSDAQLVILSAACQRDDRSVLPLPKSLKGGAAKKVIDSLLAKGLIAETETSILQGDTWRKTDEGKAVTLVATETACEALNIGEFDAAPATAASVAADDDTNAAAETGVTAPDAAAHMATGAEVAPPVAMDATPQEAGPAAPAIPRPRKTRDNTKQAQLIAMLRRPEGATIDEIVSALGWQAHTARGALAGALKKKLGLTIVSEKVEGRGRTYKIAE